MRIVLDANVLVRATPRSTGPAREVLKHIRSGPHFLVLSDFILAELGRALQYPRVRALFEPPLALAQIQAFLEELRGVNPAGTLDTLAAEEVVAVSKDPDDDPVIQTAVAGRADVLCTLDRHIRRSRKVREYCAKHGIRIMTDVELLRVLRTLVP